MLKKLACIVLGVMIVITLNGCKRENKIDEYDKETEPNLSNIKDELYKEILGQKYKNINDIKQEKLVVNNDKKYSTPITDKNGEIYVKYSDSFESPAEVRDGEFVEMSGIELLPTKIYTTNTSEQFLYKYKDELYYIPVMHCETESDARIEYRDYGFILWGDNSVSVNGKKVSNLISGDWRHSDLSDAFEVEYEHTENFYVAYTSVWKAVDANKVHNKNYELTTIYQYDYDGNINTPELLLATELDDHVHVDTNRVKYNLFSVNDEEKFMYSDSSVLWLAQMPKMKNVFYGEQNLWTEDKIHGIKENIYIGYWVYDKNKGLVYVDRLANGKKLDSKEFMDEYFTLDDDYYLRGNQISKIYNYNTVDENNNPILDESSKLEKGTNVRIKKFSEHGLIVNFILENEQEIEYYGGI